MIDVAELYRAEARGLHRFALFLSGDPALAEDLVAETFIRVWNARQRVDLARELRYGAVAGPATPGFAGFSIL